MTLKPSNEGESVKRREEISACRGVAAGTQSQIEMLVPRRCSCLDVASAGYSLPVLSSFGPDQREFVDGDFSYQCARGGLSAGRNIVRLFGMNQTI
jgi:hypothetical protein